MQVHLTQCDVRASLDANPEREAVSRSARLLHDLSHVVNIILTKSLHLFSRMLSVRFIVLMSTPKCVLAQEHIVLKHFPMESRLR